MKRTEALKVYAEVRNLVIHTLKIKSFHLYTRGLPL